MENDDVRVKWPLVVTEFDTIYFNRIDLGNYTMFRLCLFKTWVPRLGLYASIEGRGSYFFSMERELHKNYVAEKLSISGDCGQMADFLNAQLKKNNRQQGTYYSQVIKEAIPYGLIGEVPMMPWIPEIVSED